ncbi:fucose permease [Enterococcus sp. PF1-24]|uniref:MFS transporter n=1 Tax=unclassified Enterococcus TaxID=2608891 RepID=UPI00247627DC|nr:MULTISPECIES: MFS transporter [unclassified Enterococcus]MDH6363232.1 fucose permease [Enterococcus sp. PFB1-1]MDH6400467.1 fucose permease [Enterococcus sp. PF1-24]
MKSKKVNLFFLLVIYIIFISLGLPDSVLGVAWPTMYEFFGVKISAAGMVTMICSFCTMISSLNTGRLVNWLGIGKVVTLSVTLTAGALIGFACSSHFIFLLLLAIPLGTGAGAIDTALNDYVALNFKAHHMNWLHAFWGVGATLGPIIFGGILKNGLSWRVGYGILGGVQILIVFLLIYCLPLWKQEEKIPVKSVAKKEAAPKKEVGLLAAIRVPGVIYSVLCFVFYVGIEASIGLWGSTYLISEKGISVATASFIVSLYFASLTVGRLLSGFLTFYLSNKQMLILSEVLLVIGVASLFVLSGGGVMIAMVFIGLGSAAIFPTMLHETPHRFGSENSAAVMSLQIALSSVGTIVLPPILGLLAEALSIAIFPVCLLFFAIILLFSTYRIAQVTNKTE